MSGPTIKHVRAWERRAKRLKRSAENLLDDMMSVAAWRQELYAAPGADDLTDFADNVVHQTEELLAALAKTRALLSEREGSAHD